MFVTVRSIEFAHASAISVRPNNVTVYCMFNVKRFQQIDLFFGRQLKYMQISEEKFEGSCCCSSSGVKILCMSNFLFGAFNGVYTIMCDIYRGAP